MSALTFEEEIRQFANQQWGVKTANGIALKLAEETGEVAGACVKLSEGRAIPSDIDDEIGDVLIVLSQLAALRGTTLDALRARRFDYIKHRAAATKA